MYVHLLEIVYAVKDRETVEQWLSQAELGGVIISTEQYDDEILTVLASRQVLEEAYQLFQRHPAISSCEGKWRTIYRVATTGESEHVLCSFPYRPGEEWYLGSGNMVYLSVGAPHLSKKQLFWLATNPAIANWSARFDLPSTPVLAT